MVQVEDPRRRLPSVDRTAEAVSLLPGMEYFSRERIVDTVRSVLSGIRRNLSADAESVTLEDVAEQVRAALVSRKTAGLRRVVNGTGIVLHTGLGRAVLPEAAMEAVAELGGGCNLQIDLEDGGRGRRDAVVEDLVRDLTGSEAATVVNNNAAATLLVLAALARDREVIVSRGQLIEIGGSFRLPDVIAQSGARMVEVGTTNKTHVRDYENAITGETAVLLRVNPSNYRIVGFAQDVPTAELVPLKKERDIAVVDDLGCGNLVDLSEYGLPREPTLQESIAAGADIALSSGDKLLGGPQCGIIIGRTEYIERIRKHPLARALRVGKFTIAALEATLKLFLNPETLREKNPTLRMLGLSIETLRERAASLARRLGPYLHCEVTGGESACGGGSLPDVTLPTTVVSLRHKEYAAGELARRLRTGNPPVIPRVHEGNVLIDVRTLLEGDDDRIEQAVRDLAGRGGG